MHIIYIFLRCPVSLSRLRKTADEKIDICGICKKNVYLVESEEELREKVSKGQCVAFTNPDVRMQREEEMLESHMIKGRIRPRPKPYEENGNIQGDEDVVEVHENDDSD